MSFFKDDYVPTCADCKHACYYPAPFYYPYLDPLCEITKMSIQPDDIACQEFELIGRRSR